ncbi:FAD-binding oxidoreductase [Homoserinibacter sp. YIM 151385]|uniref:FAD-binding oxidoreductase n=1 Tax=Homoserinibacter sp. YIM 151385 TaxID=2985506 RepID=UPI0022EFFF21|nr:FAD-linked oxidase C-terminal domain-containing protein [Homoserinibacter sp. YIM 151385]WBU38391.1 FAD-binding protein [Homoserinibacter sp. YIM 151385]
MDEALPADALLVELRTRLGDAVSVDPAVLEQARADRSGHRSGAAPLALVEARSIDDVQETMRFASRHRIPVVPRGAGTGLAGGAIGSGGELVLSLARMDRILEVSVEDELAVVEPGVVNGDLDRALEATGLWFAPDPASRAISTIGGNIATNAGGLLCVKYGVTREAVLGLRAVLADGSLLETGRRTVKGVTGLDLTALLVGSEGTLAVIVEATVRLRRRPAGGVSTLVAGFADAPAAADAASRIMAAGARPAVMELLDAPAVRAIAELFAARGEAGLLPSLGLGGEDAVLLVQADGRDAAAEIEAIRAVLEAGGASTRRTDDPAEGERLFTVRRAFHPAMERRGTVLIEDVSVPRSRLGEMLARVEEIGRRHGIAIPTVAHAGDGNLHPNLVVPHGMSSGSEEVPSAIWAAADELFRACLELGGTLTGEHGVGILKRRWLEEELGASQLALQRRVKAAFDPLGILNPGKAI